MNKCFSPLGLQVKIRTRIFTSGNAGGLFSFSPLVLMVPGFIACIHLSCVVKSFWVSLNGRTERPRYIGSLWTSSLNIKRFRPLDLLIWRHLNTRVILTWLSLISENQPKIVKKALCISGQRECNYPLTTHVAINMLDYCTYAEL